MGNDHRFDGIKILESYGRRLEPAAAAAPRFVLGREQELAALARAVGDRRSVVVLGPSQAGKTALLWKLALEAQAGRLPGLEALEVWEMGTTALVSDTSYVGEQESKIARLLEQLTPQQVLYVPDAWNLPSAGTTKKSDRGLFDLFRPAIEAGALVLIAEMSAERWALLGREQPRIESDFTVVPVEPLDEALTSKILRRQTQGQAAQVRFERAALHRLVALTRKFMPTRSFPGKAVETLRQLASAAVHTVSERPVCVDADGIEELFSAATGLPLHMISLQHALSYASMRSFLDERVLGQDEAVEAVADTLTLYKTGLCNPERPAGVLLLIGPTGVGKTELAKATAELLFGSRERLFRLDLSEYKDYHSFEKLIGDGQGRQPGLLTSYVRQNPLSVVLLDEFEKGHANIADLFLQVFDDGRLTDGRGETVDFRHCLLFLTSNLGSALESPEAGTLGFGEPDGQGAQPQLSTKRVWRALEGRFRPEFINRLDKVVVFRPLRREHVARIARKEIAQLYRREGLLERDLLLEVADGVIDLLVERGFDPRYGARPLKRAIESRLVLPLARALLSKRWQRFQLLRVVRRGDDVQIRFEDTQGSKVLQQLATPRAVSLDGEAVQLSLAQVREQMPGLLRRLEQLRNDGAIAERHRSLQKVEAEMAAGGLEQLGRGSLLAARHELKVELRRFEDLVQIAEAVQELAEDSFHDADDAVAGALLRDFLKLERDLLRAVLELGRFGTRERGGALLRIRPVGAREGGWQWACQLADMYAAWATARGHELERSEQQAPRELQLKIDGLYAYGYLRGEQGEHRRLSADSTRERTRALSLLARVSVQPLEGEAQAEPRSDDDAEPVRVYDLWQARSVKDRRSGHVEKDVKKVLQGRIGGLLRAAALCR